MDEPRTVAALTRALETGLDPDYVLFWGHTAPDPDEPGPWWLSQWWPAAFGVEGREFASAEHYMMWRKAVLFDDARVAEAVLATPDPARAKALGREVAGFDSRRWAADRFGAVVSGNRAKFGAHPVLRAHLVGTAGRVLVEASPDDTVWGIGLPADHADARVPARWRGTNLLGFALMQVREELARR